MTGNENLDNVFSVVSAPTAPHIMRLLELHLTVCPVILHPLLCQAAQNHSVWMAQNRRLSHRGENRSTHGQRIEATGYPALSTAENIAMGYPSPERVFHGWMNSRGHRRNIERDYTHIGIGESNNYWCTVFADPVVEDIITYYDQEQKVL